MRTQVTVFARFFWVICLPGFLLGSSGHFTRADDSSEMKVFPIPVGLVRPAIPSDNPITQAKVDLGKLLFNDKRLSSDGNVSCATCHISNAAFADGLPVSTASHGQVQKRNTPTIFNVAYFSTFNWDGAAATLEQQAKTALLNPHEMGASEDKVLEILSSDSSYAALFSAAFGSVSLANAMSAIAAYERTLLYANSPFDRHLFCGDDNALSNPAKRGYKVFLNKGNCIVCHQIQHWSLHPFGPDVALFTDDRFHNLGVGMDKPSPDLGRYAITQDKDDIGAFKTPSLRNVALTSPYMHDGSLATLEEVVEFYVKGGNANEHRDPGIEPLRLTDQDKLDLVEFLKSLTGSDHQIELNKCREDSHEK
jgi:cytochrome c peroxidase